MHIYIPIWLLATLGGSALVWGALMTITWYKGSSHPAWPSLTSFQKLSISSASVIPYLKSRWLFSFKKARINKRMRQRTEEVQSRLQGEIIEVDSMESLRSLLNSPVVNGKTIRLVAGEYSASTPIHVACKDVMVDLTDCRISFPALPVMTLQGDNNILYNGVFLFPDEYETEDMVPMASDTADNASKALFLAVNGGGDHTSMLNISVNPEGDAA